MRLFPVLVHYCIDSVSPAINNRQKLISRVEILDQSQDHNILEVVYDTFKASFATMKIPDSPFYAPKLGPLTKEYLGHTNNRIDMRLRIEPSPVGVQLREHLTNFPGKHAILLGKSGVGKTTAIFDAAKTHWCVLLTASSLEEDLNSNPAGFDRSFAALVNDLSDIIENCHKTPRSQQAECEHAIKCLIYARLVVMWAFQKLKGAKPFPWLVYQLTHDFHMQTLRVYDVFKKLASETIGSIKETILGTCDNFFVAFERAQCAYELFKNHRLWNIVKTRGVAAAFIHELGTCEKPVILAGRAIQDDWVRSCTVDLGEGPPPAVFDDFPILSYSDIQEGLGKLLRVQDVDLQTISGLWKLGGRGRLFGGLFPAISELATENPNLSKKDILEHAVERHCSWVVKNLTATILQEVPPREDLLYVKPTLSEGLQKLAIQLLRGRTISLDGFSINTVHKGLALLQRTPITTWKTCTL